VSAYICTYARLYGFINAYEWHRCVEFFVRMCLCMHVYMYLCIYVHMFMHLCTCLFVCMYVCMLTSRALGRAVHACVCSREYVMNQQDDIYMYTYICTYIYIHIYICTYVYIYIHVHVYISLSLHLHTSLSLSFDAGRLNESCHAYECGVLHI